MLFKVDDKRIAHQLVDGEVIAIDFANGAYFSMRGSAAEIWQRLVAGADVDAILASYPGAAAEEIGPGVRSFVDALVAANLLAPEAGEASVASPGEALGVYQAPILEKFDDMADLIMMDPVHDVSEIGWPHTPRIAS